MSMTVFESQARAVEMMEAIDSNRTKLGISADEIAKKTVIHNVTYRQYVEGDNTPTIDRFLRLADAVGMKVVLLPKIEVKS